MSGESRMVLVAVPGRAEVSERERVDMLEVEGI